VHGETFVLVGWRRLARSIRVQPKSEDRLPSSLSSNFYLLRMTLGAPYMGNTFMFECSIFCWLTLLKTRDIFF
ncbi:hypothetical protein, partial [Klebsiella pneumoniae]|uniref:hypothetical protein n=1 Tax=Klebsiella pneumoniae TaxID=573 RepID=UPI001C8F9AEC